MDSWFFIIISLCFAALIRSLLFHRRDYKKLPPGPSLLSSNFLLLRYSLRDLQPILRNLKPKYGPLITLSIGSRPFIFVGSQALAHQMLIQKGSVFSDRPRNLPVRRLLSASYGPTWRLLRRNLATGILHPSRVKSYSWARKYVLHILINRLQEKKETAGVKVDDHFQYAMFCLLVLMCFGQKLDEHRINEIVGMQCRAMSLVNPGSLSSNVLRMFPRLGKILFRNRWKELLQTWKDQERVLISLIKSRTEAANSEPQSVGDEKTVTYVDTLVNLELPEEEGHNGNGGKLTDKEMMRMCSEFLNSGTHTTTSVLEWIMAYLIKYPDIQSKLYHEIIAVVGHSPPPPPPGAELESVINEEDQKKMPYLEAVILEGLRRHPPGHFVLPHRVTKETEVQGFTIPKGATINFMVTEMGLDSKVWDDPMAFKPERFLVNDTTNGVFDITGRKGIKMMPFGVGIRMCPATDLALLHLEYFVANLIWYFHWIPPDGYHVDLSEKADFIVVMKNPLHAEISSRTDKITT